MNIRNTNFSFLAVAALLLLLIPSASAGILTTVSGAINDGSGPGIGGAWQGTSSYESTILPGFFEGTVDYAVMTAANFGAAFPTSTYTPTDAVVYLYQVNHSASLAGLPVTAQVVGVSNPASGIGNFENASGEVPVDTQEFGAVSGDATWTFPLPGIGIGASSVILAFSSPNLPVEGAGVTFGPGLSTPEELPTPGSVAIPEPASVVLLVAGLAGLAVRRNRK